MEAALVLPLLALALVAVLSLVDLCLRKQVSRYDNFKNERAAFIRTVPANARADSDNRLCQEEGAC